ncbi:MAG: excinuclease ABC subunit UvrA [Proteobacteria bacterium]|nr:excinuclease ABC subunit UvrA [Pseudomonadota bacterium]
MSAIQVRRAATHNLKGIDVDIPRDKMTVITGPSGSGKSSLAFDTIYAEGQRRYVESLSPYARQFLGQMSKPDLESMDGLSPTIAIDQRSAGRNPRSTVGTVTEIHDFLRLLFARIGRPHCYKCGKPISAITVDQMVDHVMDYPAGARFSVLAPIVRDQRGDFKREFKNLKRDGFVRVMIDDEIFDLSEDITLDKRKKHSVYVYVDRLVNEGNIRNRLADSIELAIGLSSGIVIISPVEGDDATFTDKYVCVDCNVSIAEMSPTLFSFNNPAGACPNCSGLGQVLFFDEVHIIPDPTLSLREGAIAPWTRRNAPYYQQLLDAVTTKYHIDPFTPWRDLPDEHRQIILKGTNEEVEFTVQKDNRSFSFKRGFEGVIPNLERRSREYERRKREEGNSGEHDFLSDEFHRFMSQVSCPECKGARLRRESLNVNIGGKNIAQVSAMTISKCLKFFESADLTTREASVAKRILYEICTRLRFIEKVGVEYVSLDRPTATLSGGEAQRIRLATQIGSALVGVTYVLDEPSIGLHQRDNNRLIETLHNLRDQGNTIIVVEHDSDTMLAADHIIDMGPGAGVRGGTIVAEGKPNEIARHSSSLTGKYLSGRLSIDPPKRRRIPGSRTLVLKGASTNNLKGIDVRIPLGLLVAVTGVSGSGKSSLIVDTLLPALKQRLYRVSSKELALNSLEGIQHIDKVIDVDQNPIGRTPRSNPATFTQVFTLIRDLFATLPESKMRGYKPGRYSFNVKGGRCEACQGDGLIRIEMNFLPDVFVKCEVCGGKRYNRETLEIRYKGKNIADILEMTANQAYEFLESHPKIRDRLATIRQVGLGYLALGQCADTLSGGEAQRLKLAKELSRRATGRTLYMLDEPTTGLHFDDVRQLMTVLEHLVDQGNSVVVIEHNLDVIKCADWVIDLGPGGGDAGGQMVASGTPEEIARVKESHTGKYLSGVLGGTRKGAKQKNKVRAKVKSSRRPSVN